MIVDTQLNQLRSLIDESDAILVGAGGECRSLLALTLMIVKRSRRTILR